MPYGTLVPGNLSRMDAGRRPVPLRRVAGSPVQIRVA
jgi:hypothetical protein